jgi:16S rRNA C1402 N4-methylase RsmH
MSRWYADESGKHNPNLELMDVEGEGTVDGILAVLSYHSMEDKMAKRVIRDGKVDFFEKGSIKRRGGGGSRKETCMETLSMIALKEVSIFHLNR